MRRRTFVKTTGLGVVTICTCEPGMNSCSLFTGISHTSVAPEGSIRFSDYQVVLDLELIPELNNSGGSVKFEMPQSEEDPLKVLVINSGENGLQAFENRCTHGGREIEYRSDESILRCVSFGHSKYDLSGQVTGGPAPAPLKKFKVSQTEDKLIIDLV